MPRVSVVVPVYNVEHYIKKCLDSLVNQTLKDIEIVIVNDGSTDKSKEIVEEYLKKYDNIIYLEKENGGLSDARNYGLLYATGDYIAFLDSDDYIELNTYELMYNKAIEESSDLVECDFLWEYPNKKVVDKGFTYYGRKEMIVYARVVAWNKLIRRKIIEDNNMRFSKGLRYEDVDFFYKMIPIINKVSFVKVPLIHYVQRNFSISKIQNEKTKDIFTILDNVIEYYKMKGFFEEYKSELEYTYIRILLCSSLMRIVKIKDKQVRDKLERKTFDCLNLYFPLWKKNKYLKENICLKNIYMKSVNKFTFKIYCFLFRLF